MSLRPDGVLVSNGPGDPKKAGYAIDSVRSLTEYKIPIFGICLGNQILGLALGCDTYKLKFGHRGQNHPAVDAETGRCYVTSQNHGFAISGESVRGRDISISFYNGNDRTVEGISHSRLPFFGVQFHPEASPGPVETKFLFDRFIQRMEEYHAKG
jgi:carbamoyl-phosphate synthase small subunit